MKKNVELANFVVTSGDEGLLDIFEERVWPLMKLAKISGRGEIHGYRFLDLRVEMVGGEGAGYPCLYGRLIRLMTLQAEQRFDESLKETLPSKESVESAPSAFFLVSLADHKLAFLPESRRRSPGIADLQFCLGKLLQVDWKIRKQAARDQMLLASGTARIPYGQSQTWEEELQRRYPEPQVRITPLAASMDLRERFALYEKIQTVEIRPFKTNNELADENADFLRQYAEARQRMGSSKDKIELSNKKDGLRKEEAEKFVEHASDGNYKVKMKGLDKSGRPLNDDLENMRIQVEYPIERNEVVTMRAFRLLGILLDALKNHAVLVQSPTKEALIKARGIVDRIQGMVQ